MNQAYKVICFSLDRRTSVFVLQFRCSCENCQIMGRAEACICCQEIEAVKNKLVEAVTCGECDEQPTCITQHPGFHPVCINRWVLQTAWYQYKQQYKDPYDGPENKLYRHIAYRQLARWCWGILGREIRGCASILCSHVYQEFLSATWARGRLCF